MHSPVSWLMKQEGPSAVRARRSLGLDHEGDGPRVLEMRRDLAASQLPDGSFDHSPLKTAGVLNLLADLRPPHCKALVGRAVKYLVSVLRAQPGYERAWNVKPGSLQTPCDLCGFFGPYEDRRVRRLVVQGAVEINLYRQLEPLLGPKTPVRDVAKSTLDRPGPGSCYSWGLIPLAYVVEAICRAGHAASPALAPAFNVLLGAQRASGGWCRNLSGHPSCTLHALRALGAHPLLRKSVHARRALQFMTGTWNRATVFPALQAVALFDSTAAREMLTKMLADVAARQRKDGAFGAPCQVERVAAVLMAKRSTDLCKRRP